MKKQSQNTTYLEIVQHTKKNYSEISEDLLCSVGELHNARKGWRTDGLMDIPYFQDRV